MSESRIAREARPQIFQAYLAAFVANRSTIHVGEINADVFDLHDDTRSFLSQAERARDRGLIDFPCVAINRVDRRQDRFLIRFVPLDFRPDSADRPEDGDFKAEAEAAEKVAREGRLPVFRAPQDQARRGFFEGVVDTIIARSRWSQIFGMAAADPKVTVTASPGAVDVCYSTGHYFSTARGFGRTTATKSVKAGTYCFWRKSEAPHTGMDLWDIHQDWSIPL